MAVTRLQRKVRKNRVRSRQRKQQIKLLTAKPTIKNLDLDALKASLKQEAGS